MIENKEDISEVIFADTLAESPATYETIEEISEKTNSLIGIKVTVLKPEKDILYYMSIKRKFGKNKGKPRGFMHPKTPCWWKREIKINLVNEYIKQKNVKGIKCIGLRELLSNKDKWNYRYPLKEYRMSYWKCYKYVEALGLLNIDGCYFCPKKDIKYYYNIYKNHPESWSKLEKINRKNNKLLGSDIYMSKDSIPFTTLTGILRGIENEEIRRSN